MTKVEPVETSKRLQQVSWRSLSTAMYALLASSVVSESASAQYRPRPYSSPYVTQPYYARPYYAPPGYHSRSPRIVAPYDRDTDLGYRRAPRSRTTAAAGTSAAAIPKVARPSKPEAEREPAGGPLIAVISIANQRLTLFDQKGAVTSSPISSGRTGFETPTGVFSIIEKNVEHFSNLYDDAPMPHMQRITWSGVAFHAGRLPGYPASHGCIRLPAAFAQRLFSSTSMGTRVVIAHNEVSPVSITHPRLFAPRPSTDPRLSAAGTDATGSAVIGAIAGGSAGMVAGAMQLGVSAPNAEQRSPRQAELPVATDAPRQLDAVRAGAHRELASRTKALNEAKAAHAAKQREHAKVLSTLDRAERDKAEGEERLEAALKARFNAKNETAATKAELAEQRAQDQIAKANQIIAEADAPALAAREQTRETQAMVDAAEAARGEASRLARELDRKAKPISVFISRKTERLYVRQGNEPVFDTPVLIKDAHLPVGTHVYTAMSVSYEAGPQVTWQVITPVDAAPKYSVDDVGATGRRGVRGRRADQPLLVDLRRHNSSGAAAALDRVEISEDAVQRISESLRAGSSLIISDEPVSRETGKGTDFVILTE